MPMPAPQEQLGSFYLGAEYDLAGGVRKDDSPIHYDARDLVTHAVCVGMTGSGKTGLCVGLLEEAALDKVPGILIDPKGDITNLLLQFPDLQPADFAPWINAQDAERKGQTVEEFAAATAGNWQKGLTDWGIGGDRMRKLAHEVGYTIFTPGSDMGVPLNIMGSLAAPKLDWAPSRGDPRAHLGHRGRAAGAGRRQRRPGAQPRGHPALHHLRAFLAAGAEPRPGQTDHVDPAAAGRQMGVFDVDTFFPEKDRFNLAMAFNTLVASPKLPGLAAGRTAGRGAHLLRRRGQAAPQRDLHRSPERQRAHVYRHADPGKPGDVDARQSGTTSLRALLYFDEIFGYFPPVAEPSSKRPLLTLLKQAAPLGWAACWSRRTRWTSTTRG
jgi:hypothetical protein